jgi:hypothetical protein
MSHVYENAAARIIDWLHHAERDLIGRVVTTFNAEAGAVRGLKLDDHHGLCFSFEPEGPIRIRRWFPVSTIKIYGPKEEDAA